MKITKTHISLLAIAAFVLISEAVLAQPSGGSPVGGGSPGCWPPPCIPIDGGMSFLVALGVAFGGKKLLDMRSK
jgi:hypothetical protein